MRNTERLHDGGRLLEACETTLPSSESAELNWAKLRGCARTHMKLYKFYSLCKVCADLVSTVSEQLQTAPNQSAASLSLPLNRITFVFLPYHYYYYRSLSKTTTNKERNNEEQPSSTRYDKLNGKLVVWTRVGMKAVVWFDGLPLQFTRALVRSLFGLLVSVCICVHVCMCSFHPTYHSFGLILMTTACSCTLLSSSPPLYSAPEFVV